MSINLFDSIRGSLGNDVIENASNALGESESNMQKAVSGVIPSILTGIMDKAGSGEAGSFLRIAKETFNSGMLTNIGRFFTDNNLLNRGTDLLKGIFGDRLNNVSNMIAGYSGIKPSSATALMSAAAPAALGVLGRHATSTNINSADDFITFLNSQKNAILNAVPPGLDLAGALGMSSLGNIGNRLNALLGTGGSSKGTSAVSGRTSKKTNWLVPAVIALAVIGLLWFFMGKRTNRNEQTGINRQPDTTIASAPPVTPMSIKVQLPNGTEINAYKGGIEDRLVRFLNDPDQKVDKNTWFDFDKVTFETGSAVIIPESRSQVQNIAAILKAFPNAVIKIGGYTDKMGDEGNNQKLSQARAASVLAALKNEGVPESQLAGAEGYGSQFAKAAADAPDEERKKDRRMAVSVRQK